MEFLYENGEAGFSAAVDALTFNGIDPTEPDGAPEVGTSGVPLYCIDSLFALTEDIPIDKISVTLGVEPFIISSLNIEKNKEKGSSLKNYNSNICKIKIIIRNLRYIYYFFSFC